MEISTIRLANKREYMVPIPNHKTMFLIYRKRPSIFYLLYSPSIYLCNFTCALLFTCVFFSVIMNILIKSLVISRVISREARYNEIHYMSPCVQCNSIQQSPLWQWTAAEAITNSRFRNGPLNPPTLDQSISYTFRYLLCIGALIK